MFASAIEEGNSYIVFDHTLSRSIFDIEDQSGISYKGISGSQVTAQSEGMGDVGSARYEHKGFKQQ